MIKVFSVYDSVAKEYGPLFQAKNVDVALRNCKFLFEDTPKSNCKDYDLVEIGEFDEEKGSFLSNSYIEHISFPIDFGFDAPVQKELKFGGKNE